ncbi:chaperone NapD [Calderihabitans maritimus]|uniref:Glutamate synthase subunit beta n=1 Tax=Calderihabitans maritimus TaxID=1246530 RepID=A0A1Z5HWY6_9FIRM|nr:chaperone NapD [Calderihabitans maritimus]GAW94043.1 glutamate synthase subunit beta [Calderihabitans maritimus]
MVISGILVRVNPEDVQNVVSYLETIPGVSVHGVYEDSKIIVVLETETTEEAHRITSHQMAGAEGVLGVYLAYCNFEDEVLGEDREQEVH